MPVMLTALCLLWHTSHLPSGLIRLADQVYQDFILQHVFRGIVQSLDHLSCSWPPYRLRICGPHRAALQIRRTSFAVSQVTQELLDGGRIMT